MEFNANQFGSGAKAAPVLVVDSVPDDLKRAQVIDAMARSEPGVVVVGTPEPIKCPAPVAAPEPAAPLPIATRQQLLGDFLPDFSDIIMPRLNICQNLGDLKDEFPLGALVLGQKTELWRPPIIKNGVITEQAPPPVEIIVVGFRPTRYVEKTTGGARGNIVNTPQEVVAAGGTTEYAEAARLKKPLYQPLAEAVVLIKQPACSPDPEGAVFSFTVPEEGGAEGKWALCFWSLKGSAYTAAGKSVLFKERRLGFLQKCGYPGRHFHLTNIWKEWDNGSAAWVPVLVAGKKTAPETLEWVQSLLAG